MGPNRGYDPGKLGLACLSNGLWGQKAWAAGPAQPFSVLPVVLPLLSLSLFICIMELWATTSQSHNTGRQDGCLGPIREVKLLVK